jgi:hypothetical protein
MIPDRTLKAPRSRTRWLTFPAMTRTVREPASGEDAARVGAPVRVALIAGVAMALAIVLWGGYGRHWSWTGINGSTATLWDWLHLLLLPIAFGMLPIWLSRGTRLKPHHKAMALTGVTAFGLLVVAGYVVPWAWTGFTGNKLWDWLELIALPIAVALTPIFGELRSVWTPRHSLIALGGLAVFVGIVVGGYVGNWGWTGFRGNTLWDWLHLLLLPLLLPTLVVPALRPVVRAGLILVDDRESAQAEHAIPVEHGHLFSMGAEHSVPLSASAEHVPQPNAPGEDRPPDEAPASTGDSGTAAPESGDPSST